MLAEKKIRVLVVDDTQFYREILSGILADYPDIEVVDTANDAFDAREKIKKYSPDVLTLDVEMPGMNGLDFLEKIMTLRPMPVVIVSTLTGPGTDTAIAALQLGAVDCVGKPAGSGLSKLQDFADELIEKVRTAAQTTLGGVTHHKIGQTQKKRFVARPISSKAPKLIAIGASTGGVETLTEILTQLPSGCPPIAITQHMPPGFTTSFAARLSKLCAFPVYEATSGMTLSANMAVIAPGGRHLKIMRRGTGFGTLLTDEDPVNRHKPSVDVLFDSAAACAAGDALGMILTGMGNDGAAGLLKMRQSGAQTIAEDEASCIVYGMPGAAVKCGAVMEIHSLDSIPQVLVNRCFA